MTILLINDFCFLWSPGAKEDVEVETLHEGEHELVDSIFNIA